MNGEKEVYDYTYNGDLFRIIFDGESVVVRVYERGLNKGYELDIEDAPYAVRQAIKELFQ